MFLKHPALLWLKRYNKDKIPPFTDNQLAIFETGHMFETYAEQLFENGVTIGFKDFKEYESMPQRTKDALNKGAQVIFQGAFKVDNLICIVDVLQKNDDGTYDLIEIKSSTKVKKDHIYDLAFQAHILRTLGLVIRDVKVLVVNNEYVKEGDINAQALCKQESITEKVNNIRQETSSYISQAQDILQKGKDNPPSFGIQHINVLGTMGDWLPIYNNIHPLPAFSIFDLTRLSLAQALRYEKEGYKTLSDIDDLTLSDKQIAQIQATKTDTPYIDTTGIKGFIKDITFPIYFLDYETIGELVPPYDGTSPYQSIPFQYSLHRLDKDGTLTHTEYIHTESANPVPLLSKQLQNEIGSEGSVVVWSQSFEKRCNMIMGNIAKEYYDFFQDVNNRIIDLMDPFKKDLYVDKKFLGSASIKKVLPVIAPNISYQALDIQEGETAQRLWREAFIQNKKSEEEQKDIVEGLKKYCKLDTLAMVEIYTYLGKIK